MPDDALEPLGASPDVVGAVFVPREGGAPRLYVEVRGGIIRWAPWADPALARSLIHPNIVRLYEAHAFDDPATFVLEHVPGPGLDAILERSALPPRRACQILREVARALTSALDARGPTGAPLGFVHGALRPRAVRLGAAGEVKVAGFGVGLFEPAGPVPFDGLDERVLYMPPEAARGADDDHERAADVFRATAILHTLIEGRPIGPWRSTLEALRALARPAGPTFADVHAEVSPALRALLVRGLAADPAQRPPDARALLAELDALPELTSRDDTPR